MGGVSANQTTDEVDIDTHIHLVLDCRKTLDSSVLHVFSDISGFNNSESHAVANKYLWKLQGYILSL